MTQNAPPGFAQVPAGHEVRIYRPTATAYVLQSKAGPYIVDLGASVTDGLIFEQVQQRLNNTRNAHLIWILQESYLYQLSSTNELLAYFKQLTSRLGTNVTHAAVFPLKVLERFGFMQSLKALGINIYFAGADYACIVELKRPDDIIIGMAGRPFLGDEAPLSQLLETFATTGAPASYQKFLAAFRQAPLGVVATPKRSTNGEPSLGCSVDAQGRSRLLTFADPDAFQINYGDKFNAEMIGEDVLRTLDVHTDCVGIQVNSATDEVSLTIQRADALNLLKQQLPNKNRLQEQMQQPDAPTPSRKAWWRFGR